MFSWKDLNIMQRNQVLTGQEYILPFESAPIRALSPAAVKMKTRLGLFSLKFIHLKITPFDLVYASQIGFPPNADLNLR